jgi:hypothetical protein
MKLLWKTRQHQKTLGTSLWFFSMHVVQGTEAPQTVKLMAHLFAKKIIMLVDSGSSSSFISQPLAKLGPNIIPLSHPVQVQVANGQIISCTHYLPQCKITLQGHTFYLNLKVLPLQCYDVILGMDWLTSRSPMEIHWEEKWLAFTSRQQRVVLQGLVLDLFTMDHISASHLCHLERLDELWCTVELHKKVNSDLTTAILEEIQHLVHEYNSLFDKPSGLPPLVLTVTLYPYYRVLHLLG